MNEGGVLLGFSGGIDSSHAALLLRGQGYRVTALYMDMYGDERQAGKARARAHELGLEFRCADIRGRFRENVIDYFLSEYLRARTPAPCTICNREIKWAVLREIAIREGYDRIATGHYFNISRHNGKFYVSAASDPAKDQSYYLWPLDQGTLSMALTPMGDQIKERIRHLPGGVGATGGVGETPGTGETAGAGEMAESMGICFLSGRSYTRFLRDECGGEITRGEITDREGRVIGVHDGIPYYTIGQKRGLGLPRGNCVTAIDPHANRLVAGTDVDLYHRNLVISGCNIVDMDELFSSDGITVKIRGVGRNPAGFCKVSPHQKGIHVSLSDPAWAAAAGQPVVFYHDNRVLGGGFLEEYY